jgi:hypothetical protein
MLHNGADTDGVINCNGELSEIGEPLKASTPLAVKKLFNGRLR